MTRYIINSNLTFDSAVAKLTFVSTEDSSSTHLSAPAARCLENLIVSRGSVINKATLLEKSWRDYGFVVTDNSVNQVISHIRKCFDRIGVSKDIIVTVPKLGYQFNPEYRVEIQHEGEVEKSESDDHEESPARPPGKVVFFQTKGPSFKDKASELYIKHKMIIVAAAVTSIAHLIFSLFEGLLGSGSGFAEGLSSLFH